MSLGEDPMRYSGGEFCPALFQVTVHDPTMRLKGLETKAGSFAHEYTHFIQTVGTTYNANRHFDIMNWIAHSIEKMGGSGGLILHGQSDVRSGYCEHIAFHATSMDGKYGSRKVGNNRDSHQLVAFSPLVIPVFNASHILASAAGPASGIFAARPRVPR